MEDSFSYLFHALFVPRPRRRLVLTVSVSLLLLFLCARADDGNSNKRWSEEFFSLPSSCCCEVPSSSLSLDDLPLSASSAPPQTCSSSGSSSSSATMRTMKPATAAAPRGATSGLPSLSALFGGPLRRAKAAAVAAATPARPLSSLALSSPKLFPSSPCDRDLCVAAATAAAAGSSSSSSSETAPSPLSTSDWWMDDADLWEEPRTKEEFDRALLCASSSSGGGDGGGENEKHESKPEIVLVAFYASWCKGCRRLHPELTALAEEAAGRPAAQGKGDGASSPLAGGRVKFVRVNYDRLRSVAASAGATVLPFVAAFAPGEEGGKAGASLLLGWQAVASRPGATRANLVAMLSSSGDSGSARPPRGKKWAFPKASSSSSSSLGGGNGSGGGGGGGNAAPLPELVDAADAEAADRTREAEKLAAQASTAGLFERLAAIAGGGSGGAGGAGPPSAARSPPPPLSISPSGPSRSHPLARATPEQRETFLRSYPGDHNPRAEPVAAAEIAPRLRGLVYLDSTGGALYSNTQVDQMAVDLKENAFGNPHTGPASPPAALSSARIGEAREMVLEWFNADPGKGEMEEKTITTSCLSFRLALLGRRATK